MDHFSGAFLTQELAIDTSALARALRGALAESDNIDFLPEHGVVSVERADGFLRVEGTNPNGTWRIDTDQVVNALWENRIAFDRMIGLHRPPLVHRLARVHAKIPDYLRGGPSANDGPWTIRRRSGAGRRDGLSILVPCRSAGLDA
jgi:hypothetical protein